jgi:hypothetical protein
MVTERKSGVRVAFDKFDEFRDNRIRSPLIGRPELSWLIALSVAALTVVVFREEFLSSYSDFRSGLPAAMVAVVGFVITALSVLVAVGAGNGGNSVASFVQQKRPDGWKKIIYQISGAAKMAGLLAVLVSIEPFLRATAARKLSAEWVDVLWVGGFMLLATLVVMSLIRVIWLLERTTSPVPPAQQ